MKNFAGTCAVIACFSVVGCAPSGGEVTTGAPSLSTSITTGRHANNVHSRRTIRQSDRLLGPDERRVAVFVVPGDALVEVDGQTVDRWDGVIELVGKVGETRRLRAWKGDKSSETKVVTIEQASASPSFVDVNEAKPRATEVGGKEKAARFDLNE